MPYPYRKGEKFALIGDDDEPLTLYCYDRMVPPNTFYTFWSPQIFITTHYAVYMNNHGWGIIDESGKELLPCIFDVEDIKNWGGEVGAYIIRTSGGVVLVDKDCRPVLRDIPGCDSFSALFNVILACDNGGINAFQDIKIFDFSDRYLKIQYNGMWAVFNSHFDQITDFEYDEIWDISKERGVNSDYFLVSSCGHWKAITPGGGLLYVLPDYSKPDEVYEDGVIIIRNEKYGFINHAGKCVQPIEFDDMYGFVTDDGGIIYWCVTDEKGYLYDRKWRLITKDWFEEIYGFDPFVVKKVGWGVIDQQGMWIIPPDYDDVRIRSNGYLVLEKNSKMALYKGDQALTGFIYDDIDGPCETDEINYSPCRWGPEKKSIRFIVTVDGKIGLIDGEAKEVVAPVYIDYGYENDKGFGCGLLRVALQKTGVTRDASEYIDTNEYLPELRHGYIDWDGNVVIPIEFEYVEGFRNGLARVSCNVVINDAGFIDWHNRTKMGAIDMSGRFVIPCEQQHVFADNFEECCFIQVNYRDWVSRTGRKYYDG